MKGYRSRSSADTRTRRVLVLGVCLLVVFLLAWLLPSTVRVVSDTLMSPVQAVRAWVLESPSDIPRWLRDRSDLVAEIHRLEQALVEERGSALTMSRLLEENRQFRTLLRATTSERILAGVMARPTWLPYDLVQIDRGLQHGVVVGAPVFIGRDGVLGLVTQAHANHAFVEPFSSPQFQTSVYITEADVVATLEGMGGGVARVRVPQGVPLRLGQSVHVLGLEPGIYGELTHLEQEATQPEQFGYVSSPYSLAEIRYVTVGTQPVKRPDEAAIAAIVRAQSSPLYAPELLTATTTATSSAATSTDAGVDPVATSSPAL